MDFDVIVRKRASVKRFSSKKPPVEKITEIIETANMAFTHGNLHILKYILVDDQETIAKIAEACQQEFIKQTPYVIVVCSDSKQLKKMYDIRADKYLKHHIGAIVENFLLKVTNDGLASSWVGAFSELTLKNLLHIPEDIEVEVILPVGYELIKGKTKQHQKQSLVTRLFFNEWNNRFYKPIGKIRRDDI